MKKIFISYSSKDQKMVDSFIEFLQLGMGIRRQDIFCTACPDMLETGKAFIEKIREYMQECETVIFVITEQYLKSPFCLVEMGAAWGLSKQYFPLLTVPYEKLNNTPLMGIQMRRLDNQDDLGILYDELHRCGVLDEYHTAEFNRRVAGFVGSVKDNLSGNYLIEKDENGYYETTIESVRELSQKQYRCYGIKGHIADPPDKEKANSDWLFYWGNTFPDLMPGDRVRFKTTKTKINVFPDLGRARNIYPDDLKKIEG
ncbi:MAG TPA: toll/interleukin-1 receptor domain-containing protein [Candidatus Mediterraneibacter norfolkensis]|nr:toll/interleukin-1 receptor domain-containing protein [Candidatus Mediterraneibacter norfolkensis]